MHCLPAPHAARRHGRSCHQSSTPRSCMNWIRKPTSPMAGADRVGSDQGKQLARIIALGMEGSASRTDGSCRMRRSQTTRRRRTSEATSLEQLEDWIDHLDPSPLVDGVSMLDGYLTATVVGPCSVNPYE